MFCPTGTELHRLYEIAEQQKLLAVERREATGLRQPTVEREIQQARQRYVETFANWLSHKAFCLDCKPSAPARGEQRTASPKLPKPTPRGRSGTSDSLSQAG